MRYISNILLSLLLCLAVLVSFSSAGDNLKESGESYSHLKRGKELLDAAKYDEAIESLKTAYDSLPLMKDYTLLFMAKAHNRAKRFGDSDKCIDGVLKSYPGSQTRKRMRVLQLYNLSQVAEAAPSKNRLSVKLDYDAMPPERRDAALKLLESLTADYPDDAELAYRFGLLLRKTGSAERAKNIFIRIYTGGGPYSEPAYRELTPSDITSGEMLERATNLIKAFDYKGAESLLRKTLVIAGVPMKEEIYNKLGLALFKQKRYRESGDAYSKAGDSYNRARSLLRAGDLHGFEEEISKLVSMDDKRAGSLLITYAAKKRREGKVEESLDIYNKAKKKYPALTEEILWGAAWTHYRSGNYKDALSLLTELNERYPSSKYKYWKQRCGEDSAESISPDAQTKTRSPQKDFYSLLSRMRDKQNLSGRPVKQAAWTSGGGSPSPSGRLPHDIRSSVQRFAMLNDLGMKEDAVSELIRASNAVSTPDAILHICHALQEAGAYRRAINLAAKVPEGGLRDSADGMDLSEILYPLAYPQIVGEAASRYTLDPYILLSVIREESRFDQYARSMAGALGLMQIMPHTARSLNKNLDLDISGDDEIYDVKTNVTIGAYYLNSLLKEFGSLPVALAAYNAGHDKVREWIREGNYRSYDEFIEDIPYDETRNYVKKVLLTYITYLNLSSRQ